MITRTQRRPVAAFAGALALFAAAIAGAAPAQAAEFIDPGSVQTDPITLDTGHIDAFNPIAVGDGKLNLALKEDVTGSGVLHTPESVKLLVKTQAIYDGITNARGAVPPELTADRIWYLPLTQDRDLVWPGWDSMEAGAAVGVSDNSKGTADIMITDVQGPGDVFIWSTGTWGTYATLLNGGKAQLPGTIHQSILAHTHANWAFTAPGIYTLTAHASVTNPATGQTATSEERTYTFVVASAPESLTISGAEDPIPAGQETVTLTARTLPEDSTLPLSWYTRSSEDATWSSVAASGNTVTVPAVEGTQYQVRTSGGKSLVTGGAAINLTSDSVTLHIAAPLPAVTIEGAPAHHLHSGAPISLTAQGQNLPENASYVWEVKRTDQTDFALVGNSTDALSLTAEQAFNGASVRVSVVANGEVLVTSDPITLEVDDHGAAPLQKIEITGLAAEYHNGDAVELRAGVAPASVIDTWAWYVTNPGQDEVQVAGHNGPTFSLPAATESMDGLVLLNGATVKAALIKDDGSRYVASDPVNVVVVPADEPTDQPTDQPTGEPTDQPTDQPTGEPTDEPTDQPTGEPTDEPTDQPTGEPTDQPTDQPTGEPTGQPTAGPTDQPTGSPTAEQPTQKPTGNGKQNELPNTGVDVETSLGLVVVLLVSGAAAVAVAQRKRSR